MVDQRSKLSFACVCVTFHIEQKLHVTLYFVIYDVDWCFLFEQSNTTEDKIQQRNHFHQLHRQTYSIPAFHDIASKHQRTTNNANPTTIEHKHATDNSYNKKNGNDSKGDNTRTTTCNTNKGSTTITNTTGKTHTLQQFYKKHAYNHSEHKRVSSASSRKHGAIVRGIGSVRHSGRCLQSGYK